ncbi:MAG TPA: sigma-70 family RNA polymerase sigma factor [Actinomycetota bacterium]
MERTAIPPFSVFLEEHRSLVYRFLAATVGRDGADDCFQETFLSALRAYPRLRPESNLRAWVMTIATNKAMDHGRRVRRSAVPVADVPERAAPAAEGDGTDPEVWAAVRELPPLQRAAVVHRYVLDLPYAEVAEAIGTSEEAARANAYEGRKKLRAALGGHER